MVTVECISVASYSIIMLKTILYSLLGIAGALIVSVVLVFCSPVLLHHYGNALIAASETRVEANTRFTTLRARDVQRRLEIESVNTLDDIRQWAERSGVTYDERSSLFFRGLDLIDYPEHCTNTLFSEHRFGHFYVYKSRQTCPLNGTEHSS
ncbi:hypothetical protein NFC81_11560 [Salinispirillum sp. LH 10-3-1]|uniref:Uncharacterized protein n=1 Tax=Salinispirillum sp. LH 10-3-1 TaxID=2952525 RepID=A0AB38YDE5_9GAMM